MLFVDMHSIANLMATSTKEAVSANVRKEEGEALRRLIEHSKYNQASLAAAAGVGTKAVVAQLVSGARPLNLKAAYLMAAKLEVKLDDFTPRLAALVRQAIPHIKCDDNTPAVRLVAQTAPLTYLANPWPFSTVTPTDYARISLEARRELEALARGMVIQAQAATG